MKKLTKILNWLFKSVLGGLILIITIGLIVALIMSYRGWQEWRKVEVAAQLVKKHFSYQITDRFSGCVHPNNGVIIVTFNSDTFFGVKDDKVFIPKLTNWHEERAKALAPDLEIEEHEVNIYYLLENCR